jgi:hypothetical protein
VTEGERVDVETEHPHVHHHRSGHRLIDLAVPLAALFISLLSIGIAWKHGQVMKELVTQNERLVQANSLPYLELNNNRSLADAGSAQKSRIYFSAVNRGVGPAEVRSVQVTVDGRPVRSARQLVETCCGPLQQAIGSSTLNGRMIQSGQEVRYVDVDVTPQGKAQAEMLFNAFLSGRVVSTVCYCSVFDECWKLASTDDRPPQRVDQCSAPQPQYRD